MPLPGLLSRFDVFSASVTVVLETSQGGLSAALLLSWILSQSWKKPFFFVPGK
jgi:hypothetical protein